MVRIATHRRHRQRRCAPCNAERRPVSAGAVRDHGQAYLAGGIRGEILVALLKFKEVVVDDEQAGPLRLFLPTVAAKWGSGDGQLGPAAILHAVPTRQGPEPAERTIASARSMNEREPGEATERGTNATFPARSEAFRAASAELVADPALQPGLVLGSTAGGQVRP